LEALRARGLANVKAAFCRAAATRRTFAARRPPSRRFALPLSDRRRLPPADRSNCRWEPAVGPLNFASWDIGQSRDFLCHAAVSSIIVNSESSLNRIHDEDNKTRQMQTVKAATIKLPQNITTIVNPAHVFHCVQQTTLTTYMYVKHRTNVQFYVDMVVVYTYAHFLERGRMGMAVSLPLLFQKQISNKTTAVT